MEQEEHSTGRHVLAVALVAVIGLAGLVLMFNGAGVTGDVIQPPATIHPTASAIPQCNINEVLLSARGVDALRQRGRARYGEDFSPYSAAHINYNGVGYCANGEVVRDILG